MTDGSGKERWKLMIRWRPGIRGQCRVDLQDRQCRRKVRSIAIALCFPTIIKLLLFFVRSSGMSFLNSLPHHEHEVRSHKHSRWSDLCHCQVTNLYLKGIIVFCSSSVLMQRTDSRNLALLMAACCWMSIWKDISPLSSLVPVSTRETQVECRCFYGSNHPFPHWESFCFGWRRGGRNIIGSETLGGNIRSEHLMFPSTAKWLFIRWFYLVISNWIRFNHLFEEWQCFRVTNFISKWEKNANSVEEIEDSNVIDISNMQQQK
jgi:hypothetical protein